MKLHTKIVKPTQVTKIAQALHAANKKIVVLGGCFDILHVGHLYFLEQAKKYGDILIVLLENDNLIKKLKGSHRPINTQVDRARLLASLTMVDYVILLNKDMDNHAYDQLIWNIKPAIIATTELDPYRGHKERQAQLTGSQVVDVIQRIENTSTSRIASLLQKEL